MYGVCRRPGNGWLSLLAKDPNLLLVLLAAMLLGSDWHGEAHFGWNVREGVQLGLHGFIERSQVEMCAEGIAPLVEASQCLLGERANTAIVNQMSLAQHEKRRRKGERNRGAS